MEETGHIPVAASSRRNLSRDEMNLAEFPLTVLSTRSDPRIKTLEFQDSVVTKNGQTTLRKWVITGADKFGLPTSSDDEVLLGLLKLTVDEGIRDRKVFFTRYELLRVLRWTTEGRSYSRLQNALDRLSGVRIKATNAFYDNESKSHSTKNFGIIDAYEINDGRDAGLKPSFFIWSEEIFKSFQVGFIKKLDLDFYLELKSAVSKRLYRYLDKHFWYKSSMRLNLFVLAHEKIGISRNYQYASLIRQQLDPALDELIERGFVANYEYCGKGKHSEIVIYSAQGARRSQSQLPEENVLLDTKREDSASPGSASAAVLAGKLVERGIKAGQAERLLSGRGGGDLERIGKIIAYYDKLLSSGSRLISKSPIGFLYRAVEQPERFVLPEGDVVEAKRPRLKNLAESRPARDASRERFLASRSAELARIKAEIEPGMLQHIRHEVEQGLQKVKELISPEHFAESIEHGIEEKLVRLFALPNFEEWQRSTGRQGFRPAA